jgi:hypothetical protein
LKPYSAVVHDSAPTLTADFKSFLNRIAEGSGDFSLLSDQARSQLVPGPIRTLRRDLQELGPITSYSVAAESGGRHPLERVYRVEGANMVEFYTVRYTADSTIDDLELLREY